MVKNNFFPFNRNYQELARIFFYSNYQQWTSNYFLERE